ncbi:MAG: ATP-binding cassette domain-containing protein [Deltaproteobacteria bacterium]|nr:ATP-binding cassette domain-containing protein [Deltaproteobacteria bacterium]
MIIEAKNVSRTFRSTKKAEGFKGALGLLLKPEYQSHDAVKNVSFSIEEGSFNGLIGANGAGKTTLLKMLSGLIAPTSGEVRVLGYDPFKRPIDFRKKIALVMGQKAQLWWDLPGVDAFDLLRAIYDIPSPVYKERLNRLAELLDVTKHLNTQIRRLSLGERMKMELIGALIHWPKVIFLDEPTIGLDVLAAHKLREFLKEFNRVEKATIILTSHNMEDIERLCSRVLILKTGEMIYDGKPEGLTKKGECRLRVRLMQKPTADELAGVSGVPAAAIKTPNGGPEADGEAEAEDEAEGHVDRDSVYFTTKVDLIPTVLQKLMAKFTIVNMGIEEQSLESVIQRLYTQA